MTSKEKKTILLVEDEAIISMSVSRQLEDKGYAVLCVSGGKKAIKIFFEKKSEIDLVLMDIDLGRGIDGAEVAEIILEKNDIPVVFISNYTGPEVVEKIDNITSYGYVVKDTGLAVLDASIKMAFKLFEEKKKTRLREQALLESEEKFRLLAENSVLGIYIIQDMKFVYVNPALVKLSGYERDEIIGNHGPNELVPQDEQQRVMHNFQDRFDGKLGKENVVYKGIKKDGSLIYLEVYSILTQFHDRPAVIGTLIDITERKQAEKEKLLIIKIENIINRSTNWKESIEEVLSEIKESTRFDAVAVRFTEDEDYPYYVTMGFPTHFVEAERYLCTRNAKGEIERDSNGAPYVECMCGNILSGRTDPDMPFFTEGGSFWSNHTSKFLAETTDKDRQTKTRNRCNSEGYESVALIPIKAGSEILGLIQLNDKRTDRFKEKSILNFEELGKIVGAAFARKQAEEDLRFSEEKFNKAFHESPASIAITKVSTGEFVEVNQTFERDFGYSRESVIGKSTKDINIWKNPADREPLVAQIAKHGYWHEPAFEIFRKSGEIATVDIHFSLIRIGDEDFFISSFIDITERKLSELKIMESEERYIELINSMSSGVAVYKAINNGKDFIFVGFNKSAEKIDSLKREKLIGRKVTDVFPGIREFGLLDVLRKVYKTGRPEYYPVKFYSDKRIEGWRENYIYKLTTGEIVAIYDDVTEKMQAQGLLRSSEERYRTLFEHSGTLKAVIDSNLNLVQVNEKFALFLKKSREELQNKNFKEFLPAGEIAQVEDTIYTKNKFKTGSQGTFQTKLENLSGNKIDVYINVNKVQDTEKYLLSMIDITKVVHLENEILNITTEERSRLGQDLHDNLGQTLTGLSFLAKSLEMKLKDENKELADDASELADRIRGLIDKTHHLSKGLNPVDLESNTLIVALENFTRDMMKIYKVYINIDISKKVRINDKTTLTHIYFIITEAVNNAIKHGKATRVVVILKIVKNRTLKITVTDNGKGLSKTYKNKKGLGLMIMSNRARLINGTFNIEKNLETGGTTVSVNANFEL